MQPWLWVAISLVHVLSKTHHRRHAGGDEFSDQPSECTTGTKIAAICLQQPQHPEGLCDVLGAHRALSPWRKEICSSEIRPSAHQLCMSVTFTALYFVFPFCCVLFRSFRFPSQVIRLHMTQQVRRKACCII